uniref:Uncharacterized protein n=1 Tax=Chlamydomonas euryale TaxID=1486919 RepID=A0A7R9YUA9_9CHLO
MGELRRYEELQASKEEDLSWATQRVGPASFRNRDLYMDPVPLLTSAIVLLWVLGFMANRIFGIDTQAVKRWKEDRFDERRREIQDARVKLIESWEKDNGSDSDAGLPPGRGK